MPYRICKTFEFENAHVLSKHPERCREVHGHSRRVEVVLTAMALDAQDMVCDFKALKLALGEFLDSFDHALCINSHDPLLPAFQKLSGTRLIVFENADPTTEVMAKHMFDYIKAALQKEIRYPAGAGAYEIGRAVKLERVRLWETRSSWGEYTEE